MSGEYIPGGVSSFLSGGKPTTKEDSKISDKNKKEPKQEKKKKRAALTKFFATSTPKHEDASTKEFLNSTGASAKKRKAQNGSSTSENEPRTKKKKKSKTISSELTDDSNVEKISETPESDEEKGQDEAASKVQTKDGAGKVKELDRKIQRQKKKREKEKAKRTIFVGNLPNSADKKMVTKLFRDAGKIESIRFRSAAPVDLKLPKKVTIIKKAFHDERHNINSYVVFQDKESAIKALKMNGEEVSGLHIRVDLATTKKKHDHQKSIFVGNLPFDVEEESLRTHFKECGDIENVRIIRDNKTSLGKGFGYVNFQEKDAVEFALSLNGDTFKGRALRIQRSSQQAPKGTDKNTSTKDNKDSGKRKKWLNLPTNVQNKDFQGVAAQRMQKMKKKQKFKKKQMKNKMNSDKDGSQKKTKSASAGQKPKSKSDKIVKNKKGQGNNKTFARNRLSKKMKKN